MENSLEHLPPHKQMELRRVAAIIREGCPNVGLIILFGSYARGDWKEEADLAPDRRSGHASDYDILAVTDDDADCDPQTWLAITRACHEARLSTYARIISHEIGYLNRQLKKGQYFFSDIAAEGRVLYDDGHFQLAQAQPLSAAERHHEAQEGFAHWFEKAERSYEKHHFCLSKGWLPEAAFDLHQASEAAYKAVLLVFTGYIPNEHYLEILGRQAEEVASDLAGIFPKTPGAENTAFELLDYAYIGARYDPQYRIDEATLAYLAERVGLLLQRTETICRAKIAALNESQE